MSFKSSSTWRRIRQSWIDKHNENEVLDKRKSVHNSLLNLFGDVAATIDIDVHIDVQRIKCSCTSPSGNPTKVTTTDNHNGTLTLEMNVREGGVYKCDVTTDDNPIKGSPFFINIRQTGEKEKVKIDCYRKTECLFAFHTARGYVIEMLLYESYQKLSLK